jgi:hypothetical protein
MAFKQLVSPNLNTTDYSGWCLRFGGNAFGTKQRPYDRARKAWEGARFKHSPSEPLPKDAAVLVWFNWYGTIPNSNGKPEYDNWGDVAISVPGRGIFGTPKKNAGKSNRFDPSPASRASWLGGKAVYLGWSEDINGVRIAEHVPDPVASSGSSIVVKPGGPFKVRATPGGALRSGSVLSGQRYHAFSFKDGWAEIEFRGQRSWIGPIVWKKV